jgi:D-3-phosphoglycerate dehydrogenase / 2-oxoglutarate reductase
MKVIIADRLPEPYIHAIRSLVQNVVFHPELKENDLGMGMEDATVLVVRSTVVNRSCIEKSPQLSLIIRAGAGTNNIDVEAANESGIYVANCPGKNAVAVAELAMGLIMALDRFIPDNVSDFRIGKWNKSGYSKADGLWGRKLGIIGLGRIGEEVVSRARVFGLEIFAWSRSLTPERAEELDIHFADSPLKVASESDIISIHLALKPETRGLISTEFFDSMKSGSLFVNTSRAEIIDEYALSNTLREGRIRAAIDVFGDEPELKEGNFKSRLQDLPNLYVTHHIGASTMQAQNAVAEEVVEILTTFLTKGKVKNWVNRCESTAAPWQLVVRHYDRPGVIAEIMNELKNVDINAEELENVIFEGKKTACCTIQLSDKPAEAVMRSIRGMKERVISATLLPLHENIS